MQSARHVALAFCVAMICAPLASGAEREPARDHWAFQPLGHPSIPQVKNADWAASPVDRFVLAALEPAGMSPAEPAERATLIRRAAFDLTGVPPTRDQIATFVADRDADAFAKVIDRLLDSPRYGQRWGRYWLDVARYADTKGYVRLKEERRFPYAYTYRDWVIRAFNEDLPYDRFIVAQLAADLLPSTDDKRDLAALGFLTLGRQFTGNKYDIIDDRIDVVSRGLVGLTVSCARCHDHMYDPIPTADYYSLYGVFATSEEPVVPPPIAPVPLDAAAQAFQREFEKLKAALDEYEPVQYAALIDDFRRRSPEYLVAAAQGYVPLQPPLPKVTGELRQVLTNRWVDYIAQTPANDPVFGAWHALAELKPDEFATEAVALTSEWNSRERENSAGLQLPSPRVGEGGERNEPGEGAGAAKERPSAAPHPHPSPLPSREREDERRERDTARTAERTRVNPLLLDRLTRESPKSMAGAARIYGELLAEVHQRWQTLQGATSAAASGALERLPDAAEEQLRQVFYAPDSPVAVSLQEAFGEYLYDGPIHDEITKRRAAINQHLAAANHTPPRAHTLVETALQQEPRVLVRGNPGRPGQRVPRHFLSVLARGEPTATNPDQETEPSQKPFAAGSARLDLARAIADRDNPLTARVLVNRVWAHHFGAGLVRTPSNFGVRGQKPTHPELLDYLAGRFMAEGWSIKKLHRWIMVTNTYQQSSRDNPDYLARDPENRLLWKMDRRRLDFEALRDSMLAVAGRLDASSGGPGYELTAPGANRRTVYALVDRQSLPGMLPTFDFANPDAHSAERHATTVPQQALFLMNSPLVVESARAFAARPDVTSILEPAARAARMIELAWGRAPSQREIDQAVGFVTADHDESPAGSLDSWEALAQTLLMANEFYYVD